VPAFREEERGESASYAACAAWRVLMSYLESSSGLELLVLPRGEVDTCYVCCLCSFHVGPNFNLQRPMVNQSVYYNRFNGFRKFKSSFPAADDHLSRMTAGVLSGTACGHLPRKFCRDSRLSFCVTDINKLSPVTDQIDRTSSSWADMMPAWQMIIAISMCLTPKYFRFLCVLVPGVLAMSVVE
jgi:hypothetical protein